MNTTQDGEKDIVNLFYELTQIYRIFEFVFLYAFILSDHLKKLKTMTLRMNSDDVFQLISLPDTVFEQTLGFLSFHEISILRRVSKKFNETCMRLLNQGFRSAEKFHGKCLKVTNLC